MYYFENALPLFIIIHYQHSLDNNSKHLKQFRLSITITKLDKKERSNFRVTPMVLKN